VLRLGATNASCILLPHPLPFDHGNPSRLAYSAKIQYLLTLELADLPTRTFSSSPLAACSFMLKESCSHNCVPHTLSSASASARSVCTCVFLYGSLCVVHRPQRYAVCWCSDLLSTRICNMARCSAGQRVWARSARRQTCLATLSAQHQPVTTTPHTAQLSPSPGPPSAACQPVRQGLTCAPSMEKMMHWTQRRS
jgi:hypothetical protein